jgi:hypothetical protein
VPTSVVLPSDKSADVWSVAFGNDLNFWNKTFDFFSLSYHVCLLLANCGSANRISAAGYDSGDVKIFDHRSNSYVWDVNLGSGVRAI